MHESLSALVLCGGKGERLKKAVGDRPKPMAIVNDRPFLDIILDHFFEQGIDKFLLLTGHMAGFIEEYYGERKLPFSLHQIREPFPLGTGGAIKFAGSRIDAPFFFAFNGDSLCRFDLKKMLKTFLERRPLGMIGVTEMENSGDYGTVEYDNASGVVCGFREKAAQQGQNDKVWVNGGVYLFSRRILDFIPSGVFCSLENEIFPSLLNAREEFGPILVHVESKELWDIGTEERLSKAKLYFEGGNSESGHPIDGP